MLARCPSCRNTFSIDRTGRQICPVCGKPLVVPDVAQAAPPPAEPQASGAPPAPPPADGDPRAGTPWERRAELGAFPAWLQTMQQALFEPSKLFAAARLDQNRAQLSFALWTGSIFWALGQLLDRFLLAGRLQQNLDQMFAGRPELEPLRKMLERTSAMNSPAATVIVALLTPAVVFLLLYANAGVTHVIGLALGQSKRGFRATFAACAYGLAPMVLFAVPGCGSLIALVWMVALTGIGLRETHRISGGGAAATVLAPYVVLCCLGCGSAVALALALGRGLGAH